MFDTKYIWIQIQNTNLKFSDVLPAFTGARAIGNPWSISLEVIIWSRLANSKGCEANIRKRQAPCFAFIGNVPLLKALRTNSRSS